MKKQITKSGNEDIWNVEDYMPLLVAMGLLMAALITVLSAMGCQVMTTEVAVKTMDQPTPLAERGVAITPNNPGARARRANLDRLTTDHRWQLESQREGLCGALFGSAMQIQEEDGEKALANQERSWIPEQEILSGLAGGSTSQAVALPPSQKANIQAIVRDPRWVMPEQRGFLCNALVHEENRQAGGMS